LDEILSKLLESELLSEETRQELAETWKTKVDAYKEQIREETVLEVRAELSDQWSRERDALVETVDTFVSESLAREVEDLKSDIERFRDLEAESASKIVEEKHRLSEQLIEEIAQLTDKVDAFLEERLTAEVTEMKEDLEVVRQNEFGRKVFEAFVNEYATSHNDEGSIISKLNITESKLADAEKRIADIEKERSTMVRESTMGKILSSLTGKKREQMEFVLQNVETHKLEEAYKFFIGRILKEDSKDESSKPAALTESEAKPQETVIVTGNVPEVNTQIDESVSNKTATLANLKRLAGIRD